MKDDWKRGLPVGVGTALMATILIFSVVLNASAQEKDKECPYAGQKLTPEELEPILKAHALWLKDWLKDRKRSGAERAVLCKANLVKADLQRAKLRSADLQGADLQGANLFLANLQEADLRYAKLRGASLPLHNLLGHEEPGAFLAHMGRRRGTTLPRRGFLTRRTGF